MSDTCRITVTPRVSLDISRDLSTSDHLGAAVALSPVAVACESTLFGGDFFVQPTLVLRGVQHEGVSGGGGLELGLVPGDKRRNGADVDFAMLGSVAMLNNAVRLSAGPAIAMLDHRGNAGSLSLQYAPVVPYDGGPVAHTVSVGFSVAWGFK